MSIVVPHVERFDSISKAHVYQPYIDDPVLRFDWDRRVNAAGNPVWANSGRLGSVGNATGAGGAGNPTALTGGYPGYSWDSGDSMSITEGGPYLYMTRPFTITAWIRLTSLNLGTYPTIISLKSDGATRWKALVSANDVSYLSLCFGNSADFARLRTAGYASANFLNNTRHVVITYTGGGALTAGNYAAYIDGVSYALSGAGALASTPAVSGFGDLAPVALPMIGNRYSTGVYHSCFPATVIRHIFETERHLYGV